MPFLHLDDMERKELVAGFHGKFVHTDAVTVADWQVDAGAALPEHSHPHEQITTVLQGTFEMTVAGETRRLEAGAVAVIPGNTLHAGTAVTDCHLFDVFHPARDDYR